MAQWSVTVGSTILKTDFVCVSLREHYVFFTLLSPFILHLQDVRQPVGYSTGWTYIDKEEYGVGYSLGLACELVSLLPDMLICL